MAGMMPIHREAQTFFTVIEMLISPGKNSQQAYPEIIWMSYVGIFRAQIVT